MEQQVYLVAMDGEEPQDEGEEALDHLPEEDEILSVTVDGED